MRAYVPGLDIRSAQHAAVFTVGFVGALWICGCAGTGAAHTPASAATAATANNPAAAAVPAAAPTPMPAADAPIVATDQAEPAPSVSPASAPTEVAPAAAPVQAAVKAKKPAADAAPRSKPDVAAAATALDLSSLKQRLRDSSAIGVFTKLALKNQVDDLLDKFRKFYGGQLKITLPQLRQSYELLLEKVLVLLQDSDPPLAKEIAASREAIWSLLADPQKFATL
jgi:hypothetical protein